MASRKNPFVVGEWYHCYSRGIDKRNVFLDSSDYERFLETMYLANQHENKHRSNVTTSLRRTIWDKPAESPLVALGAYCLMPNHFHMLIQEITERGISTFMQKLGTAYTMYFNKRYERSGGLLTRPFRAKHISDDLYLRQVVRYIHLNPLSLLEEDERQGDALPNDYPFSSLPDYEGAVRPQRILLNSQVLDFLNDNDGKNGKALP